MFRPSSPARLIAVLGMLCAPFALWAATGGPDDNGMVYTDSDETDGPSHASFNLTDATSLGLGDDETSTEDLPFDFEFYGDSYDEVTISSNGAFFFVGALTTTTSTCPGASTTSYQGMGVLWDDLAAGTIQTQTFGRYPNRAYVIDWEAEHNAVSGGSSANFQAWLLEGRNEVVMSYLDLTFGDAAYDNGVSAILGSFDNQGRVGLSYACSGAVSAGTSVWFANQGDRPTAGEKAAEALDLIWVGDAHRQYLGTALTGGDFNDDGYADLVMGSLDGDEVAVQFGGPGQSAGDISDADTTITGGSGDATGTSLLAMDFDGDGVDELFVGAPLYDGGTTDSGAVWVYQGSSLSGEIDGPGDQDFAIYAATGATSYGPDKKHAGAALAGGDFDDDGYMDLVVGADEDDYHYEDGGAAYVVLGGVSVFSSGSLELDLADVVLYGGAKNDGAAGALAAGDFDGDGHDDLLIGSPRADNSSYNNVGAAYVVFGAGLSGVYDLGTDSDILIEGSAANAKFGSALAAGDVDGDGAYEIAIGAPKASPNGSSSGKTYVFVGVSTMSGSYVDTDANFSVDGHSSSIVSGSALAWADLDEDGFDDLVVSAPNDQAYSSSGGSVGVFLAASMVSAAGSALAYTDADHVLYTDNGGGSLGTAVAVLEDHDGDSFAELVSASPYQDTSSVTGAGEVYLWSFAPNFIDDDGDGFVSTSVNGTDCDDGDSSVNANASETAANLVDDDCDGWIDDVVIHRDRADHWEWDLEEELGTMDTETFDFEDGILGDSAGSLYVTEGLTISADGSEVVASTIWGAYPRDDQGLRITAGSSANSITLEFSDEIDAFSAYIIDGEEPLEFEAEVGGTALISGVSFEADGPDQAGGSFMGLTFSEAVDTVTITGDSTDAIGIDDISVLWADDTDRDLDGYSENDGDCDDTDPDVNPDAIEDISNGIDDDCDGVTDGGDIDTYTSHSLWLVDSDVDEELIDFEDLSVGETLDDDYEDLGATFDASCDVSTDIDGATPIDSQGAEASGTEITVTFDELQPAVGVYVVDGAGDFTFTGSAEGTELYVWTESLSAEDTAGGSFSGAVFDYGIDELVITNDTTADAWGIDDLSFHVLGLDDADGDGYTESEGDCDDDDSSTSPDAEETWYDGTDSDCDGASDYDADGDGHDSEY